MKPSNKISTSKSSLYKIFKKLDLSEELSFKKHPFSTIYNLFILFLIFFSIITFVQGSIISHSTLSIVFEFIFLFFMVLDTIIWIMNWYIIERNCKDNENSRDLYSFRIYMLVIQIVVIISCILDILTNFNLLPIQFTGPISILQILRLTVFFRFLKIWELIMIVFKKNIALFVSWFAMMTTLIFIFGTMFYISEHLIYAHNNNNSITMWQSFYYGFILVTTIGLGDIHSGLHDTFSQLLSIIFGFVGGISYTLLGAIFISGIVHEYRNKDNIEGNKIIYKKIIKNKDDK